MSTHVQHIETARRLGREAGEAAGSWAADGNTSSDHRRHVLAMLADGDPEAEQYLPNRPNLSGEFADSPTPRSVFEEVTGRAPDGGLDPDDDVRLDEFCDAWEGGVLDTFEATCERELLAGLPEQIDRETADAARESEDDFSEPHDGQVTRREGV